MSWLEAVPTVAIAALLLIIPGLTVTLALRLRGLRALAIAPVISVSLIAVAATAAPFVALRWSVLPVLVLTVIAAASAVAWSRWAGAATRRPITWRLRRPRWALILAIAIPMLVIAFILAKSMGEPDYFSQRYDNFFHLNGVQYVLDTGNASPLWLGSMTSPDGNLPFYPSGWHAVVSLVAQLTGATPILATNAVIIVVAAVVWPIGAIFLATTLLGRGRLTIVATGVLSAAFPAFPFLPLHYGVLYPFFLGLACLPVALALTWTLFRPGPLRRPQDTLLLLLLVVPGVAIAHPSAIMALIALSFPFVIGRWVYTFRGRSSTKTRVTLLVVLALYLAAGVLALLKLRPAGDQIYWPTIGTVSSAIGEVVTAATYQYPPAVAVAVFLLAGAYAVVRRGGYARWSVLALAGVGAVLYVVAAGSPSELLRYWLTAPWYNNAPRLASIWAVAVLPLAALGVVSILRWLGRIALLVPLRRRAVRLPALAITLLAVLLVVVSQGGAIRQAAADIEYTYMLRDSGPIVSPDELTLMEELPDLVPAGAVIAADPWTGASFAYAISGREVLMPHLLMDLSDDARIINTELGTRGDSSRVCAALERTGVEFVLDFSAEGDFQENPDDYSGLESLDDSPFVELVAEEGEAKLYMITSCGVSE